MEMLAGLRGLINRILSLPALGQRFKIGPSPQWFERSSRLMLICWSKWDNGLMSFSLILSENQFQNSGFYYGKAQRPQTVSGFIVPVRGTKLYLGVCAGEISINNHGHGAAKRPQHKQAQAQELCFYFSLDGLLVHHPAALIPFGWNLAMLKGLISKPCLDLPAQTAPKAPSACTPGFLYTPVRIVCVLHFQKADITVQGRVSRQCRGH